MPKKKDAQRRIPDNDHLATLCPRLPDDDGRDHEHVAKALPVFRKIYRRALRQPDVVGVDIGYLINEEEQIFEDHVGIRFHVQTKLKPKRLKKLGRANLEDLGDVKKLFATIEKVEEDKSLDRITLDGVPIDVVEAQYAPYHGSRVRSRRPQACRELSDHELHETSNARVEPLVGGVSIGRADGSAGTLSLIVHDQTDGRACILANWHVLAGFERSRKGEPCFQPAVFDGGTCRDRVGFLKRWVFDESADAALAALDGSRDYATGSILGMWFPVSDSISPWLGMPVKKWGRTTGYTQGFVDGLYMASDIPYGKVTPRHFEGQIHLAARYRDQEFSDLGDSGAVVVCELPIGFPDSQCNGRHLDQDDRDTVVGRTGLGKPDLRRADRFEDVVDYQLEWDTARNKLRAYYAVGMLFAGDTTASRFGEFALAHSMVDLSQRLGFSIQPVFVPEPDMIPQVGTADADGDPSGQRSGGSPPRPVGAAGAGQGYGGPQPEPSTSPPDPGP